MQMTCDFFYQLAIHLRKLYVIIEHSDNEDKVPPFTDSPINFSCICWPTQNTKKKLTTTHNMQRTYTYEPNGIRIGKMLKFKLRIELEHTHNIIIDGTENLQPKHVYYWNIQFASAHNGKWGFFWVKMYVEGERSGSQWSVVNCIFCQTDNIAVNEMTDRNLPYYTYTQ